MKLKHMKQYPLNLSITDYADDYSRDQQVQYLARKRKREVLMKRYLTNVKK
jgi:hypothetical protein